MSDIVSFSTICAFTYKLAVFINSEKQEYVFQDHALNQKQSLQA